MMVASPAVELSSKVRTPLVSKKPGALLTVIVALLALELS